MSTGKAVGFTQFGLLFAPEHWLKVRLFRQFIGPPFPDHKELYKGATSVENHLLKYAHIGRLTNSLMGSLLEDKQQLKETGYSPGLRHHEFAALIETLFCEMYSTLDGLRRAIFGAYSNVRSVQKESTEKLFARAFKHSYGPEFPEIIRSALASAYETWFPELRLIRSEVTHGEVGHCNLVETSGSVTYFHQAIRTGEQGLVIENVGKKLDALHAACRTIDRAHLWILVCST